MRKYQKIKIGKKTIEAFVFPLLSKNLIVLRGKKGYIMCGYLDLRLAEKIQEAAVKIVGVSSLRQAVNAKVFAASRAAKKLGIVSGQPVREVLKLIA
jgi:uncharacterized protein YunC (DUF1805 family)